MLNYYQINFCSISYQMSIFTFWFVFVPKYDGIALNQPFNNFIYLKLEKQFIYKLYSKFIIPLSFLQYENNFCRQSIYSYLGSAFWLFWSISTRPGLCFRFFRIPTSIRYRSLFSILSLETFSR